MDILAVLQPPNNRVNHNNITECFFYKRVVAITVINNLLRILFSCCLYQICHYFLLVSIILVFGINTVPPHPSSFSLLLSEFVFVLVRFDCLQSYGYFSDVVFCICDLTLWVAHMRKWLDPKDKRNDEYETVSGNNSISQGQPPRIHRMRSYVWEAVKGVLCNCPQQKRRLSIVVCSCS